MQQSELNEIDEHLRDAARIADHLIEFTNKNAELFSAKQKALLRDTTGLLLGIALKQVSYAQPRIRDNLVEIIAEFDNKYPNGIPEDVNKQIDVLLSDLSTVTHSGYTAENQQVTRSWSLDAEKGR